MSEPRRKLIEVSLPLEVINRESGREKSIRMGHPSTLHLWWARRPLATARAVLFSQLVDDPSSRPEEFPTEAEQRSERERLHQLIERLVVWENTRDESLLAQAKMEIMKSCGGEPPPILDPFSGGGTIPLEAKRLGLHAMANDLNPLPVLINTVLLQLVDRFSITSPTTGGFEMSAPQAIAEDLRYYANRLEEKAIGRVGGNYPRSGDLEPLVYFWARTVTCPNPLCKAEVPLMGSWKLSNKKGAPVHLKPRLLRETKQFDFEVVHGESDEAGTISRTGLTCPACGSSAPLSYVKEQGTTVGLGSRMVAVQARRDKERFFIAATEEQRRAAIVRGSAADFLDVAMSTHSQYMAPPRYGLSQFKDLFSPRQLATLLAFVGELDDVTAEVHTRAVNHGFEDDDVAFSEGGVGARAYAEAIRILLALGIGRLVNRQSTLCIWHMGGHKVEQVFARQAYSMTWFYAEANPFAGASGSFTGQINFLARMVEVIPLGEGSVTQGPAQAMQVPEGVVVSTDPPYYDNVPYADLSDFFIVWHRRMLKDVLPIFPTVLSPKADELVADHVRLGGKAAAKDFFEQGFETVFGSLGSAHATDLPMTVYYAFRQSDTSGDGSASTGWETVLEGLMRAGWVINATWPVRTEQASGLRALDRNALASSVVIVCRKRSASHGTIDRRGFIAALQSELPGALRALQQGAISPVDLPQAAIGPGMAVFSRYSVVIEDDGSQMSVRSALARINEILDQVLNEQEGDFDAVTRFCLAWYRQEGYSTGQFGQADDLARARNTAVDAMDRAGVLTSRAGKVTLLAATDLPTEYDVANDAHISVWETLHHAIRVLESGGVLEAGRFLAASGARSDGGVELDLVKELAFLLFSLAEKNKWTKDALSFNAIATSWPDIIEASRNQTPDASSQSAFDYTSEED